MALFDIHHPWAFTFGILGNIISVLVYLAPMPTFMRIYKEKSTMGFDSLPYAVALFSAMLWMYYALLKTNAMLLISINLFGCLIETAYIFLFVLYASKKARTHIIKILGVMNVGLLCVIFVVTFFIFEGHTRAQVVGWVCVAVSICVFAAPLSIVFRVVRTRSVEFMPLPLSFFLTLSAVMWFAYGLFQKDLCVALPNVMGFFLGMLQMLLYGIFRNKKQQQITNKAAEAEASAATAPPLRLQNDNSHLINIEVVGTPDPDPPQQQQQHVDAATLPVPCALTVEPSHLQSPLHLVVCAP